MRPIIAVIGGSTCTAEEAAWAFEVGRGLAEAGAVVACGGLGGVMEAAARGAKSVPGSLTMGILPGSVDVREPQAHGRHPVEIGVEPQVALERSLRDAVRCQRSHRMRLVRRHRLGLAVDRAARRGEHEAADTGTTSRLEDVSRRPGR